MEEKMKLRGSYAVEKGAMKNPLAVRRDRYKEAPVRSCSGLPPRAISGFVVVLQLGSVSVSVARVTKNGKADAQCGGCGWALETMWLSEDSAVMEDHADLSSLPCHMGSCIGVSASDHCGVKAGG